MVDRISCKKLYAQYNRKREFEIIMTLNRNISPSMDILKLFSALKEDLAM
jgi:hypothetical protein